MTRKVIPFARKVDPKAQAALAEEKRVELAAKAKDKAFRQLFHKITLVSATHGTTAPLQLEPYDREGTRFIVTKRNGQRAYKKLCGTFPCLTCQDLPLVEQSGLHLQLTAIPDYPKDLEQIVFVELVTPGQEQQPTTVH